MTALIQPTFEIKKAFLDRAKVIKALDRAERSSMIKQLSFIRTRARSILRRRKKASAPGSPPSVHAQTGAKSLKMIFFGYEQTSRGGSGVVGPVRLNQVPFVKQETTVPNALEAGGRYKVLEEEVSIPESSFSGELPSRSTVKDGRVTFWRRRNKRRRAEPGRRRRWRSITISARPFMFPALQMEISEGTIMDPWHNSFHD